MSSFLCCGISRRTRRYKGGASKDLYSSADSGCSGDRGEEHAFCQPEFANESMVRNMSSLCCSHESVILKQPDVSNRVISSARTSPCESWMNRGQYESYDHGELLDEVVKLRRAVDATYSELVVTENELRSALIELEKLKQLPTTYVRKRSGSCPSIGLPPTAACSPAFSTINP